MANELLQALDFLQKEKKVDRETLVDALETALITAYKKNFGAAQDVFVSIDRETGVLRVFARKTVVEEVLDPSAEISLAEAQNIDARYNIGDEVELDAKPESFGRIAAQTAKQMVVQRIREAERGNLYNEYVDKEGTILTAIIQKAERRGVLVQISGAEATLLPSEQIVGEAYNQGGRILVYVTDVKNTPRGVQIMVSRTHPNLVRRLFEREVPEISDGTVEIMGVSREAGSRTKIAVRSLNEKVDPVGACVGQKGSRVSGILSFLGGEKIDIIKYSDDPSEFIRESLSPAKVIDIVPDADTKSAVVIVPEFQLSLAIGKEGQNARLAARLTGWKIDIKSE